MNHGLQRAKSAKTRQEHEFKDSVDSKCFPADTLIFTTSGTKRISDVQVGDYLSTTCGFSSVYLLAHTKDDIKTTFVEITTDSQHIVQLSPLHYIKVNGHYSCAKNVKLGDSLAVRINRMNHTSLTYQESRVTEVREVEKTGLYSPFTMCGDIEVVSNEMNSGVIASIYSDWFLEGLGVDPFPGPPLFLIASRSPRENAENAQVGVGSSPIDDKDDAFDDATDSACSSDVTSSGAVLVLHLAAANQPG